MISETKWMVVVVSGPARQHVSVGEPKPTRREAWQSCLDAYGLIWEDSPPPDTSKRDGWNLFHEQCKAGTLKAVKVTISWENVR